MSDENKNGERLATLEAHYIDIKDDLKTIMGQNEKIIPVLAVHDEKIERQEKRQDSISNRTWGALVSGVMALISFCVLMVKTYIIGGQNP